MGGGDRREGRASSGGRRVMGRKKKVGKEEIIEYAKELYLTPDEEGNHRYSLRDISTLNLFPQAFIRHFSQRGDKVLDLFGGLGSTLIACETLKRKCYMMEIEPLYCQYIIDRYEKFTGRKAEKINE